MTETRDGMGRQTLTFLNKTGRRRYRIVECVCVFVRRVFDVCRNAQSPNQYYIWLSILELFGFLEWLAEIPTGYGLVWWKEEKNQTKIRRKLNAETVWTEFEWYDVNRWRFFVILFSLSCDSRMIMNTYYTCQAI